MTKKLLLVAAVAMIDNQNRVLMAKRPMGKEYGGYWEFPGGKVESGEMPEAALIRELNEELGIIAKEEDLKPICFASHNYPNFHILMPLWELKKWEGVPRALEGQELKFCTIEEICNLKVPPADISLIEFLKNYLQ